MQTTATCWALLIPGWHPTPLNRLLGHWAARQRSKDHDRDVLWNAVQAFGVTKATGRRRVGLTIVLGKGERACDPDAYYKSLCDALTRLGVLVDDNRQNVVLEPVAFWRGERASVVGISEEP